MLCRAIARAVALLLVVSAIHVSLAQAPARRQAPAPPSPELQALLTRFDAVQARIRSLSADFTKTTVSPLFKEPIVARGQLYLSKPSSVLWEFDSPEPMRFLIAGNEYTGYFPARKRAERKDIRRWSEQLFRFLGVGQGSAELRRFYDIRLGTVGADDKGMYLLILEPRKRRVRKHVDDVRLWVDAQTHLPVKLAYHGSGGGLESIAFRNVRVNPDLSASLFRMNLPADVTVTTGFSGFGEVSPGAVRKR